MNLTALRRDPVYATASLAINTLVMGKCDCMVRYTGHGGYVVRYHPHPTPHLPQLPDHQDHEEEHPCSQQDVQH